MMGDSHAALFGHGIYDSGRIKATLGTGSSLMAVTGARSHSSHGLSGTIAWSRENSLLHALEANISVSAQAAAFTTKLLNLDNENELLTACFDVDDNGVYHFTRLPSLDLPH